jgi:hypothetical protein
MLVNQPPIFRSWPKNLIFGGNHIVDLALDLQKYNFIIRIFFQISLNITGKTSS